MEFYPNGAFETNAWLDGNSAINDKAVCSALRIEAPFVEIVYERPEARRSGCIAVPASESRGSSLGADLWTRIGFGALIRAYVRPLSGLKQRRPS